MNAEEIKLVINPIMETGDIKTAVNQIQGFFNKMNLSKGMKGDMEGIFRELIDEAETFEKKSKEAFKTSGDVKSFENSGKKIVSLFEKISQTMNKLGGEDLSKLFTIDDSRITSLTSEITKLEQKISQLSATEIKNVTTAIQQMNNVSKSGSINKFFNAFKAGDMSTAESALKGLIQNVQAFSGSTADTKVAIELMMQAFDDGKIDDVKSSFDMLEGSLTGAKGNIKEYVSQLGILINSFATLSGNGDITQARQDIQTFSQEIQQINNDNIRTLATNFNAAAPAIEKCEQNTREFTRSMSDGAARTQSLNNEIQELGQRATYFLSLENSVDLFRQGVRKAIDTVKELDKAMTETAVVTDFSIGDMWEKLPQYTQMANELGVATQGVYEASTLYYQQGLQTEEVMALTAETLKMARIAGLECADATNLMTAALRGFNMEINETSAQRVNDVYSELAAITAADTNEIATAMTKTASIAASANMELETTAALLAQMIETTREPAETAGTAMKTIVARFTEMKKAVGDVVSVEGEEVSVNKVDAALASVGVSLKNANGEFRNLDDVLLELASKWNSLDIMSQRYIATTAAGSRQQSRFIAMMQDYDRTMQLVDAAYDSAGSSSKQFEKTQESLESKLARLENAWNTFLMGIADDKIIKTLVDALTGLLSAYNNLTSGMGGVFGSAIRLGTVFAGLRLAKVGVDKLVAHFVNLKNSINGVSVASTKLNVIQSLTQKINNFKIGNGFVTNLDIETGKAHGKIAALKADMRGLKASIMEPVTPAGAIIGFQELEGKIVATSITAEGATESIELGLSEVSTKALLASEACEEVGEDLVTSGLSGKAVLDVLQEEYRQLTAEAIKYRLASENTDILSEKIMFENLANSYQKKANMVQQDIDNINLKGTKTLGNGLLSSFKALLPVLGKIAIALAAVAAVAAVIWSIWYNSEEQVQKRKVENLRETYEQLNTTLEKTTETLDLLNESWDSLKENEETLESLIQGSTEWNNVLAENNKEVTELLKKIPALSEYLKVGESGQYYFEEEGYKSIIGEAEKQQNRQQSAALILQETIRLEEDLDGLKPEEFNGEVVPLERPLQVGSEFVGGTIGKYDEIIDSYSSFMLNEGDKLLQSARQKGLINGNYELTKFEDEKYLPGRTRGGKDGISSESYYRSYSRANSWYNNLDDNQKKYVYLNTEEGIMQGATAENLLGLSDEDNRAYLTVAQQQAVIKQMLSDETYKATYSDAEWNSLKDYIAKIDDRVAETRDTRKNIYISDLSNQGYATEIIEATADYLSKNFEDADINKAVEDSGFSFSNEYEGGFFFDHGKMEEELKELGYTWDEANNIVKDAFGNAIYTVDFNGKADAEAYENTQLITDEELGRLIAVEKVQKDILGEKGTNVAEFFENNPNLAKVVVGDLSLEEAEIPDYNTLTDKGYYTQEEFDNMITAYKNAQNKWFETLLGGYNLLMENEGEYIYEKVALDSHGELKGSDLNKIKDNVRKVYSQQSLAMAKILEEETAVFGQDFSAAVTQVFLDLSAFEELGENEAKKIIGQEKDSRVISYDLYNAGVSAKELQGTLEKIDGSSAIKTAKILHNEIESGNKAAALLKTFMESSEDNFISAGKQIKELLSLESFADGIKDFNTIYAQTGEITSDDVRKIAEEHSLLNDIIDLGTIKASAFAKMMEDVSSNEISLLDITDDLAKAYNTLYYSADLAGDAIARLKKVEIGDSDTELGKIYTESWAALKDLKKRGAVGDSQLDKYMEQLVGKGKWQETLFDKGSRTKAIEAIDEQYYLSKNQGNLSGSFKALLKEHGTTGNYFTLDGNNDVNWDLSGIKDTEELINKLANDFDITEEYASALVADLKTYSDTFGIVLDKIDKASGYADFINSRSTKDEEGNVNINASEAELKVLAKALGKTVDELKTEIIQSAEKNVKAKSVTFQQREKGEYGYTYTTKNESTGKDEMRFSEGAKERITTELEDKNLLTKDKKGKLTVTGELKGIFDTNGKIVNQKYLDNLLAVDGVREILLKASVDDSYKEEAKRLLDDLGLGSISAQLLSGESLSYVSAYADVLSTDMYNGMVTFLNELAGLLESQTYVIPIEFKPGGALGVLYELLGYTGLTGRGELRIGGGDAGFEGGGVTTRTLKPETLEIITESQNPSEEEEGTDPYDDDPTNGGVGGGGGGESEEKRNYAAENQDKQLEALDRVRETNDREAELIDKLPEEIQGPLKLMNMAEDMAYEYQEIQINKNKLAALESERAIADAQAIEEGMLGEMGSNVPIYYDEMLESYMWNVDAMEALSDEEREKAHETKDSLDELNSSIQEVKSELDGGKIQKIFHTAGKASTAFSKALKDVSKDTRTLGDDFAEFGKKYGLEKPFRAIGDKFEDLIDETNALDKEFKGLGVVSDDVIEKLAEWGASEDMQNLVKNTLGSGGGTFQSLLGDMTGVGGEMLTGMGDLLNFDMMGMGLDMFNQMKDMASQMIQYVVQFVQTIINWWINREDWLYNLLSAIEQEVHNFNRQEQVEERFRLYSDEGLNDLVSAWEAMRESLEKQIDLNEQLIESRQAELQFLNLTNLPFSPAFYYDYTEERVIENPWVYDIYVLLLDLGAMIPEIGQIFSSIKQLMEDNKKRMEDAVKEIEDAREEILELEKKQLELRTKYMEDEIELEELVMDTIIEKQQEEIDELSAMNDAISEGNEKLIETLNNKLDLIRQQRDNEDKEEELGEKERRLAYLRQDTSNANRKEIYDLQDELKDERRDYTDELIDQKISALEEQNEKAAEQRQKQIDLLQAQLDHTEKYGLQWEEAQTLIKNGFDSEGRLRVGTDLFDMLMSKEDFTSMGNGSTRQVQQIMDWNVMSIAAAAFREINDIWDEGFGNFKMSNDVHDQSRLHLWADREVNYHQLPSWLGFLQPAYNTIQDYLWRTGNNIETFIDTGFLSGKNSSSILGKTVVPILEGIFGEVKKANENYNSLSLAETGTSKTHTGIVETVSSSLGYSFGEGILKKLTDSVSSYGTNHTQARANYDYSRNSTQSYEGWKFDIHLYGEDGNNSETIGESVYNAFREGISNLSIFK